jgi:hypothetical protein
VSRTNAEVADADLVHVAWHEAGHTLVAYLLGARAIEVSINPVVIDGWRASGGMTRKRSPMTPWGGSGAIESIPVLLAGYFAERWVNSDRRTACEAAELDFLRVRMLDPYTAGPKLQNSEWLRLMYPTPSTFRQFLLGQVRLTVRLLAKHIEALEVLAVLLLERGELSPEEVNEALSPLDWSRPLEGRARAQLPEDDLEPTLPAEA